jgi:type VI secretion system protein
MRGLLDRLGDARRIDPLESIVEHLRALLNTKTGACVTVPEFGVVDFTDIVHDIPTSINKLQDSIRQTILEFEPRLRNVTVRFVPGTDPLKLNFEVSARLADDKRRVLRFETSLEAGGRFAIVG